MHLFVIVSCACLVVGFLFGLATARARTELRALRAVERPRAPRVLRDPIVAPMVDLRNGAHRVSSRELRV